MDNRIQELKEEILDLHNKKENTGSQIYFDKCCYEIYDKQKELFLLTGKK